MKGILAGFCKGFLGDANLRCKPKPNDPEPRKAKALAKTRRRKGTRRDDSSVVSGDRGQQVTIVLLF